MMQLDSSAMYAALMHELKNNLGLLTMTLDAIPMNGTVEHDGRVDDARLLCQRSVDRLQQALLSYKAMNKELHPVPDAYSPLEILRDLRDTAMSLARGRLSVDTLVGDQVPPIWFFDRSLVEMALMNAIHNSLAHAGTGIRIEADMVDGCLAFTVRDDSAGYPDSILGLGPAEEKPGKGGTGLGLKFARLIAEAHENRGRLGELRLFNDQGAVFRFLLP
ncbi:MAG TPA: ATP-binding protein [Thiobacillaceae bacterium]|nr:ATP-binding protein [Thiobacillaceae bacterium]HNF89522.1 ATP-binding protein [Thiobacillaceae bacterium]HNI08677.1 ATP-binding protein [Thiobacillaceae bacterium]